MKSEMPGAALTMTTVMGTLTWKTLEDLLSEAKAIRRVAVPEPDQGP